jgi:ATP-dependent RNA helicase DDX35
MLRKRTDLKLILCSSAPNVDALLDYLNSDDHGVCGVLTLDTRVYPVQEYFLEQPCEDYISKTVETIFQIHKMEPMGDVVAFVPGKEDVDTIVELLNDRAQEST